MQTTLAGWVAGQSEKESPYGGSSNSRGWSPLREAANERVVLDILRRYSAYVHIYDVPAEAATVRESQPNRLSTKRLDSPRLIRGVPRSRSTLEAGRLLRNAGIRTSTATENPQYRSNDLRNSHSPVPRCDNSIHYPPATYPLYSKIRTPV
jgi:hypothetical protein